MIDWLRRTSAEPRMLLAGREVPVVIKRHPTARRMTLRLAPDGSEVRLTLPRWGRTMEGLDFAASRRDWLEEQAAKVPEPAPPAPDGAVLYRGEELALLWEATAKRRPLLTGEGLALGGPEDGIPARVRRWLEAEAQALMAHDLDGYCTLVGRTAPALRLSRAQRRWGSCTTDGTIRVNWRLIQAPDFVRRSVVAHEVAHLAHFDHSPAFHALLGELYEGDIKAANRWLKQHGRTLYTRFG
jgi:predicted metal-dependent hydrolase